MSTTVEPPRPTALALTQPDPLAVQMAGVHKRFRLPHEQFYTLKERALHGFRKRSFDDFHAVNGVTVDIARGEFFGIVGRNGSGKSTLLKCLAGIYGVDQGNLEVNGRLAPFIELGVGFNPELTARDNAIINAIMLGLSRKQAEARLDEIIAFAELEEFMDLKLKNYSSGMHVRLAFAVAIQVDADILLIDEVLAVGDANFQQKCFDQFTRLRAEGRTIVFVTHDMGAVERFCDRAMLMERGNVVDIADPASITRQYNELNFRRVRREATEIGGPEALRRAPTAELLTAYFADSSGSPIVTASQGGDCQVVLETRFHRDVDNPIFSIALRDELGHSVFATSTTLEHGDTGHFDADQKAIVRIRFKNYFGPGRYALTAAVSRDGIGADAFDMRENISSLIVHATHTGGGTVDLPNSIEISSG